MSPPKRRKTCYSQTTQRTCSDQNRSGLSLRFIKRWTASSSLLSHCECLLKVRPHIDPGLFSHSVRRSICPASRSSGLVITRPTSLLFRTQANGQIHNLS
jgi:hypothetical protein